MIFNGQMHVSPVFLKDSWATYSQSTEHQNATTLEQVKLSSLLQMLPVDAGNLRRKTAYLSRGKGLGSGRIAAMEERGGLAGEGMEKFKSKEPVFLCRGSSPMAPCISLSIGHEPALPWLEREDSSGPTASCRTPSMAVWGSCVGDTDGGERDFFFVDAPARSFNSPLFFSFCKGTKQNTGSEETYQLPLLLFWKTSVSRGRKPPKTAIEMDPGRTWAFCNKDPMKIPPHQKGLQLIQ